jgi:hypothetical protein
MENKQVRSRCRRCLLRGVMTEPSALPEHRRNISALMLRSWARTAARAPPCRYRLKPSAVAGVTASGGEPRQLAVFQGTDAQVVKAHRLARASTVEARGGSGGAQPGRLPRA